MRLFISWSGEKSSGVALALHHWLPRVIHDVEPFVSLRDITAGARWQTETAMELSSTDFGIVCVTQANQDAPWLNFEAGALAKAVEVGRVIPLAIDLAPLDIKYPLAEFQAKPADEQGLRETVSAINAVCTKPLSRDVLDDEFDVWWPKLQEQLDLASDIDPDSDCPSAEPRTDRELLEEMLATIRMASPHAIAPLALQSDHPLHQQLDQMIVDTSIGYFSFEYKDGLTVVCRTPFSLSAPEREAIRRRAATFGAKVRFMRIAAAEDRTAE